MIRWSKWTHGQAQLSAGTMRSNLLEEDYVQESLSPRAKQMSNEKQKRKTASQLLPSFSLGYILNEAFYDKGSLNETHTHTIFFLLPAHF